ncbi:MAG: hypothetical protein IJN01_05045 [Rikenellaceae bacterium]|nr:hypothetical protein [Rikenellaceae bacterium]
MAANMYIVPMKRSAGVWLSTIATMLTILFVGVFLYFFEDAGWLPLVVLSLIFVPLMVVTWLQAPQTLMIDRNTLTIGRRMKPVTISLGDIVRVERVESKVVRRSMRTMGNGGLWAYTGDHYHRQIGNYKLFATEMRNLLLIETDKQKYIISSIDTHLYRMLRDSIKPSAV